MIVSRGRLFDYYVRLLPLWKCRGRGGPSEYRVHAVLWKRMRVGHSRSRAGGGGCTCRQEGGRGRWWWKQHLLAADGHRTRTGRESPRLPPDGRWKPIYAANGRNYENLFLPLSVAAPRPVALGRCEVVPRRNGVVHAGHLLLLRAQMFLSLPAPSLPTNLVRSNIKAATNVARPQPRTPLLCRQSHRNALLTD